jgi:hypothetical protein
MRFDPLWYAGLEQFSDATNADVALVPSTTNYGGASQNAYKTINTLVTNAKIYYNQLFQDVGTRDNIANNGVIKITAGSWVNNYKSLRAVRYATLGKNVTFDPTYSVLANMYTLYCLALDANNFVMIYTTTALYAVVGTFDANHNLTWGTPVSMSATATTTRANVSACIIDTNKFCVVMPHTTNYGYIIVCTVAGTVITAGTPVQFTASTYTLSFASVVSLVTAGKGMIFFADSNTPKQCQARAFTTAGTVPTIGVVANVGTATGTNIAYMIAWTDTTDKALVLSSSATAGDNFVTVCTVSTTTITAGTSLNVMTSGSCYLDSAFNMAWIVAGKAIVFGNYGNVAYITWSGTTLTLADLKQVGSNETFSSCLVSQMNFFETYAANKLSAIFSVPSTTATGQVWAFDISSGKIVLVRGTSATSNNVDVVFGTPMGVGQKQFNTNAPVGGILFKVGTRYCLWAGDKDNTYQKAYFCQILGQVSFYNGTTLIGTDTALIGFAKQVYVANSSTGGSKCYWEMKNTSGVTLSFEIYDFALEIE